MPKSFIMLNSLLFLRDKKKKQSFTLQENSTYDWNIQRQVTFTQTTRLKLTTNICRSETTRCCSNRKISSPRSGHMFSLPPPTTAIACSHIPQQGLTWDKAMPSDLSGHWCLCFHPDRNCLMQSHSRCFLHNLQSAPRCCVGGRGRNAGA